MKRMRSMKDSKTSLGLCNAEGCYRKAVGTAYRKRITGWTDSPVLVCKEHLHIFKGHYRGFRKLPEGYGPKKPRFIQVTA